MGQTQDVINAIITHRTQLKNQVIGELSGEIPPPPHPLWKKIKDNPVTKTMGDVTDKVVDVTVNNPVSQFAMHNPITSTVKSTVTNTTKKLLPNQTGTPQVKISKKNLTKIALINNFYNNEFTKKDFDTIYASFEQEKNNDLDEFFNQVLALNKLLEILTTLNQESMNPHRWKMRIHELYWHFHNKKSQEIIDGFNAIDPAHQDFNRLIKKITSTQQDADIKLLFELTKERIAFESKSNQIYTETNTLSDHLTTHKNKLLETYAELKTQYHDICQQLNNMLSPNALKLFSKKPTWQSIESTHDALENKIKSYQDHLKLFQGKLNSFNRKIHEDKTNYQNQLSEFKVTLATHQSNTNTIKLLNLSPFSTELLQKYTHLNNTLNLWETTQKNLIKELLPDDLREKKSLLEAISFIQQALEALLPQLESLEAFKIQTNSNAIKVILENYLNSLKTNNFSLHHHVKYLQTHLNNLLKSATITHHLKIETDTLFNKQKEFLYTIKTQLETLIKLNYAEYLRPYLYIIAFLENIPFENNLSLSFPDWEIVNKKFKEQQVIEITKATPKPVRSTNPSNPTLTFPPSLK